MSAETLIAAIPAILPQPASLTLQEGAFSLTRHTAIITDEQTQAIGMLLAESLAPALGFSLPILTQQSNSDRPVILLSLDSTLSHLGNEGYTLQVTLQQIAIRGAAPVGVFYGTQTLRQLLPVEIFSPTSVSRAWPVPAVTIEDTPRFPWRGLMLDTARHFMPKEDILTLLDLLALHKLNVLHLHLTDDQGWRIEIKQYPKLTEGGAYRKETVIGHARRPQGYDGTPHGGYYTQDDLREIVAYAAARYITVVPEIEMPGHAQAAIAAYPELGVTGAPVEVATTWGIHPYLFNPMDATLRFLQNVLTEVLAIFPSPYIHIGGDEAIKDQWKASAQVQARMQELGLQNEEALQGWFLEQVGAFLDERGRRLVGWDEILDGGLPSGAIVMSWRGMDGGVRAAQAGHQVVMMPSSSVYFDAYQSNDPQEPLAIGGYLPLERVYAFEPVPDGLTPEQAGQVLGAQGALWREYMRTTEHLHYMAFPRTIALAEALWTPPARCDFADFRQRLSRHEARLTQLNVTFRPVAMWEQEAEFPTRQ